MLELKDKQLLEVQRIYILLNSQVRTPGHNKDG
jgi:hypothetical protein